MDQRTCQTRSFKAFLATQFLGAFNDNAFRVVVSLFALNFFRDPAAHAAFMSVIGALFIIPFIICSPYAGQLADRYPKRNIIVTTKAVEIGVMGLGFLALRSGNLWWMCVVLFFMTAQSAFFGPAKYGILPEMLNEHELSKGNGYLGLWTFAAIILGTACGGPLVTTFKGARAVIALALMGVAGLGFVSSLLIRATTRQGTAAAFEMNFVKGIGRSLRAIKQDPPLFLCLLAVGYFWFLGALFQMNVLLYGHNALQLSDNQTSLLLVAVALGIGLGSVAAGRLSEGKIEFGLVPIGAMSISLFCLLLAGPAGGFVDALVRLSLLGFSAGFYMVPLNAYFQQRSPQAERGQYLAVLNVTNALAILLGSAVMWGLGTFLRLDSRQIFFVMGLLSLVGTWYVLKTLPQALLRFINWTFSHTIYRLRVAGEDYLPESGGALLVCNHVSLVDWCLIMAAMKRPVRFLAKRDIYDRSIFRPMLRLMRVIPISTNDRPKAIADSLQQARDAVQSGELVCIFAEGALTRTGNMLPFQRGFELIMRDLDEPVIPVNIDSIWGSVFSFEDGRILWKWPKSMLHPVTVSFGPPLPPSVKAHEVRLAVQELSAEAFAHRGREQQKLHLAFLDQAKRRPLKFCVADSTGLRLNYIQALGMVLLLSRRLFKDTAGDQEMVGILLPSSCLASLTNGACLMAGKIPVNLNFTASQGSLRAAIERCAMTRIVTSRRFIEKQQLASDPRMIFLEDLLAGIPRAEKAAWVVKAFLLPRWLLRRLYVGGDQTTMQDVATVIFSSGSSGEPKGVMLTHANIFSNIEGFYQVGQVQPDDVVLGALPFFHSFGFTAGLCFPVGVGLSVVYHHNPLDAVTIGKLVEQYQATILIGTPTFFTAYTRKCRPEQFRTLRYAAAGAEKLKEGVAQGFAEKFGVTLFEGYGATELSPIVSMGVPDFVGGPVSQKGHEFGTVGHPIPGVVARVVDVDSGQTLGYDQEGLLLIKGPNVMKGYLKDPEATSAVIRDGWYNTGDIAAIDRDGFIRITDRLSRFSKIGGEMVPHVKVEEEILTAWGAPDAVCVVTALPDEKKGERLIVLYVGSMPIEEVRARMAEGGLPNLWIPRQENFFPVEQIPLLGSGKTDLKAVRQLAAELFARRGMPADD